MEIKKVAILTSGGDAPGMNKLIYACCECLLQHKITPYVVINGYLGLFNNDLRIANMKKLENSANVSGSIIYSSRFKEHMNKEYIKKEVQNLKQNEIDALIVIGGNGTYQGAKLLVEAGVKLICIPATIDNDIKFTDYTIGFNSALSAIVDTIDNLNNTAKTHENIFLIEAMGRDCSDLTIAAALSAKVDYIVTQYNKIQKDEYVEIIKKIKNKKRSVIFLISENIYEDVNYLHEIEKYIKEKTNINTKVHIIGFIQRGAKPTAFERYIATKFAIHTVECIVKNKFNIAIGISGEKFIETPLINNEFKKTKKEDEVLSFIKMVNNI